MAHEGTPFLPFGYDFRPVENHNPPAGPPLLSANEGAIMNTFWDDPNNLNLNFDSNVFDQMIFSDGNTMPVWPPLFGEQSMLANHFNMSGASNMSSPIERRPQSRQEHAPAHTQSRASLQTVNHVPPYQHPSPRSGATTAGATPHAATPATPDPASFDDGLLGANALVNMWQKAQRSVMPESRSQIPSTTTATAPPSPANFDAHVLSAQEYTPASNAIYRSSLHAQTHASNGHTYTQGTTIPQGTTVTGYTSAGREIPFGLQFNTDNSFTPHNQVTSYGYTPLTHIPPDSQRPSTDDTGSSSTTQRPARNDHEAMPPPARTAARARPAIQRVSTSVEPREAVDDPNAKRRRTQSFPQATAQPPKAIKQEQDSPQAASSASSPEASHSDSPRPEAKSPKSAPKRRSSTTANAGTPSITASAKRAKLSDAQRKENHIQSEKRRRAEMKKGYEQLDRLVPSLKAGTLSKAQVLQHTVVFLEGLLSGNDIAEKRLQDLEARSKARQQTPGRTSSSHTAV